MLVYFAIILIGLLGFSGLVVDVGRLELTSLQLQAATDSAAVSAATELQRGSSWTAVTNAAKAEIASFGSLNNVNTASVTVTPGSTTSGYYKGDGSTIQISVTLPVSTTVLSLIKGTGSTLNASATAVAMIPPCIYLMGHPSFYDGNNLYLASQGYNTTCPIYSTTGYTVDGFSNIRKWQAKASGPASQSANGGGSIQPTLISNAPLLTDPLAYVVSPTFSSCTAGLTGKNYTSSQPINPGTYCGGLTVSGASTTITMQPGLYIITGGVNIWGGATVQGTGVTIFLTKGGGSSFGTFHLQNNSSFLVSAPTDNSVPGTIPAILLMTDRAWSGGIQDIVFDTSTFKGDGLLYITGTGIYDWRTPMSAPNYLGFVTANLYFYGTSLSLPSNYSQLPGGNPFRTVISIVQ